MDEEELAFQKSLAKNYSEEMAELDDSERYARAAARVTLVLNRATAQSYAMASHVPFAPMAPARAVSG